MTAICLGLNELTCDTLINTNCITMCAITHFSVYFRVIAVKMVQTDFNGTNQDERECLETFCFPLRWRHNGRDSVSNHQPHDCLLNRLFRRRSKKIWNIKGPRHWPLCGEFTGDRWIPRTIGQLRGNCFHLMTSSWTNERMCIYVDT